MLFLGSQVLKSPQEEIREIMSIAVLDSRISILRHREPDEE
jgi:hypothetical protein